MNVKQVTYALAEAFASARIVFWNDAGKDFLSLFDGELFSPVEGVSVIRLDQTPALQAKLRIEREEPETKFLLYSPTPELEDPLDDWLFDIRLYARQFYADYTVTVLQDLGLTSLALREHLGSRRKFLDLPWFAPPESLFINVATFKGGRSITRRWKDNHAKVIAVDLPRPPKARAKTRYPDTLKHLPVALPLHRARGLQLGVHPDANPLPGTLRVHPL